jgi:hypothetical protein
MIFMLIFSGCANVLHPTPTLTPTFTATVTLTPTSLPINTPVPTNTKLPPCNADQTIKNLKSKVSYSESVVLYNKLQGTSFLVVWFVDPEINSTPKESEIPENVHLAIHKALILSQQLNAEDSCVGRLFDKINTIVVDKNYNGWLSAQIEITNLPDTIQTDEKQLNELTNRYEIEYVKTKVTENLDPAPTNSCTWEASKKNIHSHFSSERENVGFYFVLDDAGVNVWAQWDSQPDFLQLTLPASLLKVAMEIQCLSPKPDRIIFDVVDDNGEMQIVGIWNWSDAKSQDISQIQILYQK